MAKKDNTDLATPKLSLPSELGKMTLDDLLNDEDTEVIKKKNKISFRRSSDFGVATLELASYPSGRKTMSTSSVPQKEKKKEYLGEIIEMKSQRMSQKEIAFQLGLSESYVSKLLKKMK